MVTESQSITRHEAAAVALDVASNLLEISQMKALNRERPIFLPDVAELTGYKPGTLYMLVHKNEIPFHKVAGRKKLYFYRTEIEKWMEGHKKHAV